MATRRERVVLDLEDNFSAGVARAAAATTLLDRSIDRLDGSSVRATRSIGPLGNEIESTGTRSRVADNDINKLTGRLALLRDVVITLGPGLIPLGAAGLGGLIGMTAQLGATAGALGVTLLAVQGLGDGLKALDAYQLEPTEANLEKLNQELERLGPSGERFVRFLDSIEPELGSLQRAARNGLLPGAEESIESLMTRLPQLRRLIREFAQEIGGQLTDAGDAVADGRLDNFLEYLRTDGEPILADTAQTVGALAEAGLNLMAAFAPVERDFSGGLRDWAEGLAEASRDLEGSAGLQAFIDYIETTGPQVLDTLGSLANMLVQVAQAAAPLGGPALEALKATADVIAAIADSDLGTPLFAGLAAITLLNRSVLTFQRLATVTWGGPGVALLREYAAGLTQVTSAQDRARMSATQLAEAEAASVATAKSRRAAIGNTAALLGGLALASNDYAESTGLSNTASLALMGTMQGGWGAAIGAGIGAVLDLKGAYDGLNEAIEANEAALASNNIARLEQQIAATKAQLEDLKNTSASEAFGSGILGSVGLGPLANAGDQIGFVTGKTGHLESQLAAMQQRLSEVRDGSHRAIGTLADFAGVVRDNAEAAQAEAQALQEAVQAMRDKRAEALRGLNAELDYQQAIDDARQALKDNGRTIDETTEKGRDNLRNLYALAGAWNSQSDAAKNAKGSLQAARENFVKAATDMGMAEDRAKRLADRLFEIKSRDVAVNVHTDQADAALRALKGRMDQIRSKDVYVNVHTSGGVRPQGGQVDPEPGQNPKNPRSSSRRSPLDPLDPTDVYTTARGVAEAKADLYGSRAGGDSGGGHGGDGGKGRGQLAGINNPHLSAAELGARLANLTLKQLRTLDDSIDHLSRHSLKKLIAALDLAAEAAKKDVDKARQARDDALARRDEIKSSIMSGLGGDIWAGSSGSVWGAGAFGANSPQGALAALNAQKDRAQRLVAAINTLKQKGITGPVLAEIIGTGDVERAEAMAALSPADLGGFASAYNETQSALAAAGLAGGNAVVGADNIRRLERQFQLELAELREIKQAIKEADKKNQHGHKQNAKDVTDGVNGAASNGHRRGR